MDGWASLYSFSSANCCTNQSNTSTLHADILAAGDMFVLAFGAARVYTQQQELLIDFRIYPQDIIICENNGFCIVEYGNGNAI